MWPLVMDLLEFVIGWFIVPKVFFFMILILLAYYGLPEAQSTLFIQLGKFVLMILLLMVRRVVALGFVLDYLLDILHIDFSIERLENLLKI
ncbi:hypothetical protein HYX13_01325 [Candidatus Woesearchaeota archaeon]|nr:hypothetical protein [Candidatus Woesearchaeota archaeon]